MNIVLLGSGNVATHLGQALVDAGHRIVQVYSRTEHHAASLAKPLEAQAISEPSAVQTDADVYLIAVKDEAIGAVAAELPQNRRGVTVHTAGSVDIGSLSPYAGRFGVLYPVQTFSKVKPVDFSVIPIAVEASDEHAYAILKGLADSISARVFPCNSKQRLSLHVAAVFACNFTNHLYAIGADILRGHELDFDLIRPLILETAEKVMVHLPHEVQTGPAVRGDIRTMQRHLELLKGQSELLYLYQSLSKQIGRK